MSSTPKAAIVLCVILLIELSPRYSFAIGVSVGSDGRYSYTFKDGLPSAPLTQANLEHILQRYPRSVATLKFGLEGTEPRSLLSWMKERRIEDKIDPDLVRGSCLLCSENQPHRCHRRLAAEYLQNKWGGIAIKHLV